MSYSSWIKKTQQKSTNQKLFKKILFSLKEKEHLPDSVALPGPPDLISKCTIKTLRQYTSLETRNLEKKFHNNRKNDTRKTTKVSKP